MERENEINKIIKEYKVNLLTYYLFIRLVSVKSLPIIEINKLIIIWKNTFYDKGYIMVIIVKKLN